MAKDKAGKSRVFVQGKADVAFIGLVLILLIIGLVMLFSASFSYALSYYNNSFKFISRQLAFAAVGVVIMFVVSKIDYHIIQKFAVPFYVLTFIMLLAVFAFPAIEEVHRWIPLGPLQFQPSEFGKLAVIVILSSLIAKNYNLMDKFTFALLLAGLIGAVAVPVFFEPHISATLLIITIGVVLIFVGGLSKKLIALGVGVVAAAAALLFFVMRSKFSYGTGRIAVWLDPWSDPTDLGYQTIQSLLAIGSGGLCGMGIGQSRQKHLWVPEPHNDFIFSIVCEELGLIGALVIILLFCALVWRGFTIAMRAKDKFGSLLAVGLSFQVGLQAALNIMVVTNTIPNTGISLPFFSYGGTALVILLAEMGVILSISRSSSLEKG